MNARAFALAAFGLAVLLLTSWLASGCAHSRNGDQEVWTVARVVTLEYREPCTASDGTPAECVRTTKHEQISEGFGGLLAGFAAWAGACIANPAACLPW